MMISARDLRNEHSEVLRWLERLEERVVILIAGQLLEGAGPIDQFPVFVKKAILPHFRLEEELVFPMLAEGSPGDKKLCDELMAEHTALRELFFCYALELRKGQVTDDLLGIVPDICQRLASHARKEDAVLIPLLRERLKLDDSRALAEHAPLVMFSWDEGEAEESTTPTS